MLSNPERGGGDRHEKMSFDTDVIGHEAQNFGILVHFGESPKCFEDTNTSDDVYSVLTKLTSSSCCFKLMA